MSSNFNFKSNDWDTPLHLLNVDPEFFQVLNGPAPISRDEVNFYPSGISQLLHTYGWLTYRKQQDIDIALSRRSCYLDPSLSTLGELSRNNTKWTISRLAAALFELGNIRALKYLVESVPVKIRDYSNQRMFVSSGEQIELFIEASGFPLPDFMWHHRRYDGQKSLKLDSEVRHIGQQTTRSSIVIDNFDENDVGIYYCLSTNSSWRNLNKIKEISFEVNIKQKHTVVETAIPVQALEKCALDDKVALLIGEMNYMKPAIDCLRAPEDDIYIMSKRLEELNFRVIALYDLDERSLRRVIYRYAELLNPNVYSFFYFAGHGFHNEVIGQDYCMTTDYLQKSEGVMCAQEIIKVFQEKRPAANMLIFDMCRENHSFGEGATLEQFHLDNSENLNVLYTTSIGRLSFDIVDDRLCYSAFRVAFGLLKENNIPINHFFLKIAEEIRNHLQEITEPISPNILLSITRGSLGDPVQLHDRHSLQIPSITCGRPMIQRTDPWQTHIQIQCQYTKSLNVMDLVVLKISPELPFIPYFNKSQINKAFPYCNSKPHEGFDKNIYCTALTISNLENLPTEMKKIDVEIGLFQDGYDVPDEDCIPVNNRFVIEIDLPFIHKFLTQQ